MEQYGTTSRHNGLWQSAQVPAICLDFVQFILSDAFTVLMF